MDIGFQWLGGIGDIVVDGSKMWSGQMDRMFMEAEVLGKGLGGGHEAALIRRLRCKV